MTKSNSVKVIGYLTTFGIVFAGLFLGKHMMGRPHEELWLAIIGFCAFIAAMLSIAIWEEAERIVRKGDKY